MKFDNFDFKEFKSDSDCFMLGIYLDESSSNV